MDIKICGITNLEEIKGLNLLRPEYIGFVFTDSKRKISINQAKFLIDNLDRSIKVVGVFRNESLDEIANVLNKVSLDVIQLHGDEDVYFIRNLRSLIDNHIKIWKALNTSNREEVSRFEQDIDAIVLDGVNPGSGQCFDWRSFNKLNINCKLFLAGGLNEENVIEGIKLINPQGIDVSSGVEIIDSYGKRMKSFEKMNALIRKVRENEGKI